MDATKQHQEIQIKFISMLKQEELIKRVEGNQWIPAKPKERLLKQLRSGEIEAETLKRLESRGGG